MMDDLLVDLYVSAGRRRLTIKQLCSIRKGIFIELDKLAGELSEIIVNGEFIGYGETVVIDENLGVRVTELFDEGEE